MLPFDIEKAKQGTPVITRDGRKVRIICFDANTCDKDFPIIALVPTPNQDYDVVTSYMVNGKYVKNSDVRNRLDLLHPEPEMWANLYGYPNPSKYYLGGVYTCKEDAQKNIDTDMPYISTFKLVRE